MAAAYWWIVYTVASGPSGFGGGLAVPKIIQAAIQPKAGGDVEWVYGPYATKADATADLNQPGGPSWSGSAPKPGQPSKHPGVISARSGLQDNSSVNPQTSSADPLSAIGDFFSRLTQANTWLRAGEVLLGIILLGVAVARMTGTQNAISKVVKARLP